MMVVFECELFFNQKVFLADHNAEISVFRTASEPNFYNFLNQQVSPQMGGLGQSQDISLTTSWGTFDCGMVLKKVNYGLSSRSGHLPEQLGT